MYHVILLILLGLLCPNQINHTTCHNNGGQVTTMDGDTGGETGNPPPNPNPPTPPGGGIKP
jgi:hypothetical protein